MKPKLLVTNTIDSKYIDSLTSHFETEIIPFIQTKVTSIDYELDIDVQFPVIVTSRNATWAVDYLKLVNNDIYVVGNRTAQKIEDMGYNVSAFALNAEELTTYLPKNKDAFYLCGNLKRPEIPNFYIQNNLNLTEVEVYETELTPVQLSSEFNAVVFMSPSAVKSYFMLNTISKDSLIFALGNSTQKELQQFTEQEVITGNEPSLTSLIAKIQETFNV